MTKLNESQNKKTKKRYKIAILIKEKNIDVPESNLKGYSSFSTLVVW